MTHWKERKRRREPAAHVARVPLGHTVRHYSFLDTAAVNAAGEILSTDPKKSIAWDAVSSAGGPSGAGGIDPSHQRKSFDPLSLACRRVIFSLMALTRPLIGPLYALLSLSPNLCRRTAFLHMWTIPADHYLGLILSSPCPAPACGARGSLQPISDLNRRHDDHQTCPRPSIWKR